jgi:hypothetical protein
MPDSGDPSTDLVHRLQDAAGEEVGRFLGTIFGSASMNLDGLLGDRVGWWRFKQAVGLAVKAEKLLADKGLDAHAIPLRTSIPLLEHGSLAEDEDLVDRWVSLLANAAGTPEGVPASFSSVLAGVEPAAAHLLDLVYDENMRLAPNIRAQFVIFLEPEDLAITLSRDDFEYHMDNLIRLGLVRSRAQGGPTYYDELQLTQFGRAFVRACRPPGMPDPEIIWYDATALLEHINQRQTQVPQAQVPSSDATGHPSTDGPESHE